MEPHNLMLGNYLYDPLTGAILKVVELTEEGVTSYVIDRSKFPLPEGYGTKPIKITPSLLKRCGFECREYDNYDCWFYGTNPITHDWLVVLKWLKGKDRPFYRNGHHIVSYLHEEIGRAHV